MKKAGVYPECDALITNIPDLPLVISVADCACVYLYDPEEKAIGLIHSGWRGTQKKIVTKTAQLMQVEFNSPIQSMVAVISPCISKDFFEVGLDVYDQFPNQYFTSLPNQKFLLDLKSVIYDELKSLGIEQIFIDPACTFASADKYYSYRRDRQLSGRMMGLMMLKNFVD